MKLYPNPTMQFERYIYPLPVVTRCNRRRRKPLSTLARIAIGMIGASISILAVVAAHYI